MLDNNKTLYIRPINVASFLVCIAGILIMMSIIEQVDLYLFNRSELFMPVFHLDGNNTIPSYFSTTLLTLSSILLLMIGVNAKVKRDNFSFHWIAMAIVFLFVSIYKMVDFHQKIKLLLCHSSNIDLRINIIWIILVITLVFVLSYMRFMFHITS